MTAPRLTLALLGAALALLLGEALARLHGDRLCLETPGVVYQADARFGWSHVPGMSGWVGTCRSPRVPWAEVAADSHGLLGPERPYAKAPGTVRVLLLGGNGPEGLGVPPAQTVARLLEGSADRRRGARVEVVNAATGGFVLDNDLNFFRAEGHRYAADVVLVVVDPATDLVALLPRLVYATGQSAPAKPTFQLENGALIPVAAPVTTPAETVVVPASGVARLQLYRLAMGLPRHVGPALGFTQGEAPPDGTAIDLPAERGRARALARALLVALRDEVAAAGGTLVAAIGPVRAAAYDPDGGGDDQVLREVANEAQVPTVDLGRGFLAAEGSGSAVYLPGSARWGRDGHFVASQVLWRFLLGHRLLPASVVPVSVIGGGQRVAADELGATIATFLWQERHSTLVRFALLGLLAVALLWTASVLPPSGREWLLPMLGIGMIAALGPPALAPVAVGVAVTWWAVVEYAPTGGLRAAALVVLAGAVLAAPLAARLPDVVGVERDPRTFFTFATGVLVLRLVAYAADRGRYGSPRRSLREFLGSAFFFPLLLLGPFASPALDLPRPVPDGLAPASFATLRAHLARAAVGAGRIVLGAVELTLATALLNLVSTDVWASAGRAVGRGRLWLWVLELPLYLYALGSGLGDVAAGLGAMAGVTIGESFRAPWQARDAAQFWRRWFASLGDWLRRYVARPLSEGGSAGFVVPAAFAVTVGWFGWLGAVFFRAVARPGVPTGLLAWGLLNAAAVTAVKRWPGRGVGWASLGVVLVSWVPFCLPPGIGLGTCVSIALRLAGVR